MRTMCALRQMEILGFLQEETEGKIVAMATP